MEAVVFSGIQGAGKSTFYQHRFYATHVRLNLDMLKTRNREDILLHACLAAQQSFVVDNTNPTARQRARYAGLARAAGFRAVLYFFEATVDEAIARNRNRSPAARVPDVAVLGTQAKLEPPRQDEGFDAIYLVKATADGAFDVREWNHEVR